MARLVLFRLRHGRPMRPHFPLCAAGLFSRWPAVLDVRFGFGRQWCVEIGARFTQQGFAELIAQHTATDLFQTAIVQVAKLERPERQPDEPGSLRGRDVRARA